MIKSPLQVRRISSPQPILAMDVSLAFQKIGELLKELQDLKQQTLDDHESKLDVMRQEHAQHVQKIETHIQEAKQHIKTLLKGDPGDTPIAGIHYPIPRDGKTPDTDLIVNKVLSQIRQPKDGKTPIIDHEKIIKTILKKIPPSKDAEIDHEKLSDLVLEKIKKDKKLKVEHLDGFEQTMAPIRSLAAGFRGGGDTVAAGSNITITTSNGVKTIASSGGSGFTKLSATGTVDGNNKIFIFTQAPSFVVADGVWLEALDSNGGTNWSGTTTVTMTIPPATSLYGIA